MILKFKRNGNSEINTTSLSIFDQFEKERDGYLSEDEFELHTNNLNELNSLEKQIDYLTEALPNYSILKPLKFENQIYQLDYSRYQKSHKELILTKELERLFDHQINNLESTRILNDFYARAETEKYDFTYLKKQSLLAIKESLEFDSFMLGQSSENKKKGNKAYKGGDSIEFMKKDLSFIFVHANLMDNFTSVFEGYRLAKAKREIKAYQGQRNQNTINTNYLGLFIYAFDLDTNTIFKKLQLGVTDKARLFAKAFNLGDSQVENLRKAIGTPKGKVSKPFLKWFEQFGIDPKETRLRPFLPK